MKCPKCGKEMEKGFVSFVNPVIIDWVKGEERPETEGFGGIETIIYKPALPVLWWKYYEAYRCPDCKEVLVRLSYSKEQKTALDQIHERQNKNGQ